jgi:2-polyprenyl-3-methyl-5-hydroxy-6-metoxy-1,4-benzoquinol methylase
MPATRKAIAMYDTFYRDTPGFRFEERRDMWEDWCRKHYIEAFDMRPGQTLLDIPSGEGFWSDVLRKHGLEVTGVDLSEGGVETGRERYPGIEFFVGDAEQELPCEKGSFDIVFSRGISHLHRTDLFTDASKGMVKNLMSYVKPGGLLLFSYTTKRNQQGDGDEARVHHRVSDLVRLFEEAGDPFRFEVVGNMCQVGVQHWDSPRAP